MTISNMLHVEPCANVVEHPNIHKQMVGPNESLRVNFDYNATLARLNGLGSFKPGSNSAEVSSSSLKGEALEAGRVDKQGHQDTTTTTPGPISLEHPVMKRSGQKPSLNLVDSIPDQDTTKTAPQRPQPLPSPVKWDWDIEHEDRKRERKIDASLHHEAPFEVDRRLLKDVVREKMGIEVGRIKFLSGGTFHKAYLIILVNHEELVARVARRFMPRLKIESEVATISYLREKTNVPVPKIYHYDSNPYNRLGGEFILMSKAPGIPLSRVYHGLAYNDLVKFVKNLASLIIPLFAHRFPDIGSLYFGPDPRTHVAPGSPTPKATQQHYSGFPFSPTLGTMSKTPSFQSVHTLTHDYHIGPIISWPFFGSNRGELIHPTEMDRGPWSSFESYMESCAEREVQGVLRENEGSSAPHRLHLDPDEIRSSWHHRLRAVPGDESDDSDEYNMEESDEEWEGPGNTMYSDYRRMQRSTFLVAHLNQRENAVKKEMGRWKGVMDRLVKQLERGENRREEFGFDCHDLSLENVFVDEEDNTKITCIIDWEATTTRPLWATAHLPQCVQSSVFVSKLFRAAVAELPSDPEFKVKLPQNGRTIDPAQLCHEWLYYEAAGTRLRMAHRCAEWDGWEEGLVESILGPVEYEPEWFKAGADSYDNEDLKAMIAYPHPGRVQTNSGGYLALAESPTRKKKPRSQRPSKDMMLSPTGIDLKVGGGGGGNGVVPPLPFVVAQQKERVLDQTGDICGGRGGELGLRLDAWLSTSGGQQEAGRLKKWNGDFPSSTTSPSPNGIPSTFSPLNSAFER